MNSISELEAGYLVNQLKQNEPEQDCAQISVSPERNCYQKAGANELESSHQISQAKTERSCEKISIDREEGNQISGAGPESNSDQISGAGAGLPLAGAFLGLCVGGPVGLLAGVKLGSLAAIGGSILGYTGASIIREQREMRRLLMVHTRTSSDPATEHITRDASDGDSEQPDTRGGRRRRRTLLENRKPKEEEEQEEEITEVIYPPHLQTRQWRRLGDTTNQQSILALIKDVELMGPGGERDCETEEATHTNTVLVTAMVSSIPEDMT